MEKETEGENSFGFGRCVMQPRPNGPTYRDEGSPLLNGTKLKTKDPNSNSFGHQFCERKNM